MAGIGDLAKDASALATKAAGGKEVKIDASEVKAVFAALVARCSAGETVSVQGLGNFKKVPRKATTARNPKTGESFAVDASVRMKFTASKTLREALNAPATAVAPTEAPAAEAAAPAPAAT